MNGKKYLDLHFHHMDSETMTIEENIINEAKRIEEDTLYSAKSHLITANLWKNINLLLGIIIIILSITAAGFAFSKFDQLSVYVGILAIIVTALSIIQLFLNPQEKANLHQKTGTKYNALRNNVRIFYEIDVSSNSEVDLIKSLKNLSDSRDELNKESPQISKFAYKKAKKGIENGEAHYLVDNSN